MKSFFGPDGVLARRLPDYEYRPSQVRMADAVRDALEHQKHVIIEAGTGTGKTLAYLLPALVSGRRVLVSTGTKALQDQIFYKDIPLLEQVLDRPIDAAYLKGRNNYLCKVKLESLQAEGLFATPSELKIFERIVKWSGETETGDRAELAVVSEDSELWPRMDARRDRCAGPRCGEYESCFLTRMRRKAMESDIVVVNHHLFFADLNVRESEVAAILPDYGAVIFDEAHELEDIATEYFGFHVSNFRISELIFDARSLAERSEVRLEQDFRALAHASESFFGKFAIPDGRHPLPQLDGIAALIEELGSTRTALKKQSDSSSEWEALARRAGELGEALAIFRDGGLENYVSWIERRGRGTFLEACPIDVSSLLQERLFEKVPTCVLTSATLTVGETFDYIRSRLGLRGTPGLGLSTEFDFGQQAMLYIPPEIPDYRHPSYLQRAAAEIRNVLEISEGRAFVLFTSYQQMEAAYEILARDLPYRCFIQGRMSRSRLLDQFRKTPHAVLFATASFWQGIDVKGDALSCVIIDKLPFQVPTDPLVQARVRQIEDDGGNAFSEYQVPAAILRLKQGFGRLIRSRSDHGILAILDSRLRTRSYGRLFLASLPDYGVTDKLEALKEFMTSDR